MGGSRVRELGPRRNSEQLRDCPVPIAHARERNDFRTTLKALGPCFSGPSFSLEAKHHPCLQRPLCLRVTAQRPGERVGLPSSGGHRAAGSGHILERTLLISCRVFFFSFYANNPLAFLLIAD